MECSPIQHKLLLGDLNLTLEPRLETFNYVGIGNNKEARHEVLKIRDKFEMIDPAETTKYGKTHFTYIRDDGQKGARLDRFLATPALNSAIKDYTRFGSGGSDHATLGISIDFSNFQPGKGYWKFPEYLLEDKRYCDALQTQLLQTVAHYRLGADNQPISNASNRVYNNFIRHGSPKKYKEMWEGDFNIEPTDLLDAVLNNANSSQCNTGTNIKLIMKTILRKQMKKYKKKMKKGMR